MATYYIDPAVGSDSNAGTAAGAGNAWATPGKAGGVAASGDTVYWKSSATSTLSTSTPNTAGGPVSLATGVRLEGYQTTPGDLGSPPTLSAGSQTGVTLIAAASTGAYNGTECVVVNVRADGNSGASNVGFDKKSYAHQFHLCTAVSCATGFTASANDDCGIVGCLAYGCTLGFNTFNSLVAYCAAVGGTNGIAAHRTSHCVAANCSGVGFYTNGSFPSGHTHGTSYGNGSHGVSHIYDIMHLSNMVIYGNGGYGLNNSGNTCGQMNCAFGSNTSGKYNRTPNAAFGELALTANPFDTSLISALSSSSSIAQVFAAFRPNATAGGGAVLRAAGVIPYADVGAVQHQDTGGGGGTPAFACVG